MLTMAALTMAAMSRAQTGSTTEEANSQMRCIPRWAKAAMLEILGEQTLIMSDERQREITGGCPKEKATTERRKA